MSINTFAADEREMGDYIRIVQQVRSSNGILPDEVLIKVLCIPKRILDNVRKVVDEHPDWDNEDVAEEVLGQEV